MANIRAFDTPALGLKPTETGVESRAATARRVGGFYNQEASALQQLGRDTESLGSFEGQQIKQAGAKVGSGIEAAGDAYVAYEDHKEISHGAAVASDMFVNLEKQWNDTVKNADPNDPSVAAKFKETVLQPSLDKFAENFTTENSQKFADGIVNRYRQHFDTKTAADTSTMAGIAAKQNATQTINSLSSAVYLDPSSLDTAIDTLTHSAGHIVDSSPTIDAETGARVKSELNQKGIESLVKSAVSGMIEKNPNVDLDAIQKKYGQYINGGELKMFQRAAQTQAKANKLADKQLETYQRQQQDYAAKSATAKVVSDNFSADENGNITIKPGAIKQALDIARKYPEAGAAPADTMLKFIQSQQNQERKVVDNPAVVTDLSNRLFDPNNPLTEMDLMRASTKGDISDHTYTKLKGMIGDLETSPLKGPVYQDTMKAAHSTLVLTGVGIPGKDDVGEQNYAKFVQSFIPQYIAKSRAGTLEPNALDVKDPNSMISKAMQPFRRGLTERINDYMSSLGGAAVTTTNGVTSRLYGGVPAPAALGGIASLQRNPTTGEWRDQATGKSYNKDGSPK